MKPNLKWIDDWKIGLEPVREHEVATDLVDCFVDFWDKERLEQKSKTTRNRYSNSLHALGGYLVDQSLSEDDSGKTAPELLKKYLGPDEGPLIHYDNQSWQSEVDTVCRKLYRYVTIGNSRRTSNGP